MRRRQTHPMEERKPPFDVGLDIGKTLHHASVLDAEWTPSVPNVVACANTREGDVRLDAMRAASTAQASPAEVSVGEETTGPYWLNLDEPRTSQGSQVRVVNPLDGKARRGPTRWMPG